MIQFSKFAAPMIPDAMMHDMYELIKTGGKYSAENGGQWIPGDERREKFQGVIFPVNDKDLMYAEAGAYTQYSRKVYTNGYNLEVGGKIYDPQDGILYVVKQELGYNSIHPMKRYLIDSDGGVAER